MPTDLVSDVVMDFWSFLNLAGILEITYFRFRSLQLN